LIRAATILATLSLALPASARDPVFNPPIDCTLGRDCYIQKYFDHDPGPGVQDYTCGPLANDAHTGTDFALFNLAAMQKGVDVGAAAPGRVRATRDSMPDISVKHPDAPDITGKECGNGVMIDHGGGWQTQYCHLRRGSITVERGRKVAKGAVLGQIGLSGETEYPHVHLAVYKDGIAVDPFAPPLREGVFTCGAPGQNPLWQTLLPYVGGGVLDAGISAQVPEYSAVKAGVIHTTPLPANTPALVLWAYAYGGRNDGLELTGPAGPVAKTDIEIDKTIALFFRGIRTGLPADTWPPGTYSGTANLIRNGITIGHRSIRVTVGP
jgi:murein DD-endopeptidase MepM/ murein hydrolase activator NlpD